MASLASRLGVTVPASNGSSGKRGGSNGGRAASSSRSNKPNRPSPYSKSPPTASFSSARSSAPTARGSASASALAPTGSGVDGKWERDLFNPLSDLYNPSVNTSALDRSTASRTPSGSGLFGKALGGISQRSASLRPFGSAFPSVPSAGVARNASAQGGGSGTSTPSGRDLFGRLGMNGASAAASRQQQQQQQGAAEAQAQAKLAQEREERRTRQLAIAEREKQARERDEQRKALRAEEAELAVRRAQVEAREEAVRLQMLEQEAERSRYQEEEVERARQKRAASAVNVLVANLVDGTTPEDVKAAFGDFGEIGECKVLSSNGDTLTMQVEFLNRDDATVAVSKLDGALADGRTLKLSIQEKAPRGIALKGSGSQKRQTGQQQSSAPASVRPAEQMRAPNVRAGPTSGVPTGPRSQQRPAQERREEPAQAMQVETNAAASQSRMRSEQLLALDPRASVQTTPGARQNDREWQQRARGPLPSRAAEASTQRSRPPPAAAASSNTGSDLASRFGMPAGGSSRSGSRPDRAGDGGRERQGASGLMSRLGGGGSSGEGGGGSGQQRRGGARAEAMDLS